MSIITLDVESYYSKDVGFGKLTNEEYIRHPEFQPLLMSLRLPSGEFVRQDLYDLSYTQAHDFLCDYKVDRTPVLAQNTRFDGSILSWLYDINPPFYFDTMLMARVWLRFKSGSTSLGVIAPYLGLGEKGKEVMSALGKLRPDFTDEEWEAYGQYCDNDVALTWLVFSVLFKSIPEREFKIMNRALRWYIQPKLLLDVPLLREQVAGEQKTMQGHLDRSGLTQKILASNKLFPEWLESMGVPVPMKPSPSNLMKQIPAIAKADPQFTALLFHPNDTVAAGCAARLQAKSRIKETRMQRFVGIGERNGGKLPVPLLYSGAHTHRLAGDDAINLQNLPVDIREGIMAPDGYKIISADQGQIEARLNAVLSGQDDLVEGFRRGEDVYSDMAGDIYRMEVTAEDNPKERKTGKAIILGCGYGMGGERCFDFLTGQWQIEDIDREFAQNCVNAYRMKYWRIAENWKAVNALLTVVAHGGEQAYGPLLFKHEKVVLPSGMALHYPGLHYDGDNYTYNRWQPKTRQWNKVKIYGAMLVENICQALARELLCEQQVILEKKWETVHQVHDELWFLVPDHEVDLAKTVMKRVMETPPSWMPTLPLKVEPCAAIRASDLK